MDITLSNVAIVHHLLNTCIKLAHGNIHIVPLVESFTKVILVYWAPRWNIYHLFRTQGTQYNSTRK